MASIKLFWPNCSEKICFKCAVYQPWITIFTKYTMTAPFGDVNLNELYWLNQSLSEKFYSIIDFQHYRPVYKRHQNATQGGGCSSCPITVYLLSAHITCKY